MKGSKIENEYTVAFSDHCEHVIELVKFYNRKVQQISRNQIFIKQSSRIQNISPEIDVFNFNLKKLRRCSINILSSTLITSLEQSFIVKY